MLWTLSPSFDWTRRYIATWKYRLLLGGSVELPERLKQRCLRGRVFQGRKRHRSYGMQYRPFHPDDV